MWAEGGLRVYVLETPFVFYDCHAMPREGVTSDERDRWL